MRRIKQYYFERITDIQTRVIIVMRKPKPRSYIRRRMWWAWNYKEDKQMYKKYDS